MNGRRTTRHQRPGGRTVALAWRQLRAATSTKRTPRTVAAAELDLRALRLTAAR